MLKLTSGACSAVEKLEHYGRGMVFLAEEMTSTVDFAGTTSIDGPKSDNGCHEHGRVYNALRSGFSSAFPRCESMLSRGKWMSVAEWIP